MIKSFLEYSLLNDPITAVIALGVVLLCATTALVGCFNLLQKKALVGDAVAHAILPGIGLAFLIAGTKDPIIITIGAAISGFLALGIIDWIPAHSKLKTDTAIAVVLSVFFGIGIFILTIIQHKDYAGQAGLDQFLFGKAAALTLNDLMLYVGVALTVMATVIIFFKEFQLISFDQQLARSIGLPVRWITGLLNLITILSIIVGIQAVGVVLIAALLITPASAARFWTNNLKSMLALAIVFGAMAGYGGAVISYAAPGMPTGPWIVILISLIAGVSYVFAPKKGVVTRWWIRRKIRLSIEDENVLKLFYQLGEPEKKFYQPRSSEDLLSKRNFNAITLNKALNRLRRDQLIKKSTENLVIITPEGLARAKRVVKLHRLWELYLTKYLKIAPDHVHDDAETIEHFITPELEGRLEKLLGFPEVDPHESEIPY